MPAFVPRRPPLVCWIALVALGAGAIYLFISKPLFIAVALAVAAISCVLNVVENRRQRRVAASRRGESICTFASSFDCRATDRWIVRAVYEELATVVQFPIRPADRLEDDLKIDLEDLDEYAVAVAQRSARTLSGCEANPLYGKVKTVRELVEFFVRQPRRSLPAA
jgi:hypothetical protein